MDALDLAIIEQLEQDASQSSQQLAAKLGVAASTIRVRKTKLLRRGILKFLAFANPVALGFATWAVILINVTPGKAHRVAQLVAKDSRVHTTFACTGRYDIVVGAHFKSIAELGSYLESELSQIEHIVRTETCIVTKRQKQYNLIWDELTKDAVPQGGS